MMVLCGLRSGKGLGLGFFGVFVCYMGWTGLGNGDSDMDMDTAQRGKRRG